MLHQIKASQFYTDLGLQKHCWILLKMVKIKDFLRFLYWFRSPKTLLNPPENGKNQGLFKIFYTDLGLQKHCWILLKMVKIKDFSRPLSVFQVLFKANLIFKDFSRQSCIFKCFSSLCEPSCRCIKTNIPDKKKTTTTELMIENQWICTSLMRRYVSHLDAHFTSLTFQFTE